MIIKIAMLVAITSFYIIYFVKQLLLRKKGIAANRMAKGSKPKHTAIVEWCLLIATYGIAVIQFVSIFWPQFLFPIQLVDAIKWIGVAMTCTGVVFFLIAVIAMRDNWRAGIDESQTTNIVTTGIYRISRNPAFVGFDILYIGTTLALSSVVMFAAATIGVFLMHMQILEEEKYLGKTFDEDYTKYMKNTPRYLVSCAKHINKKIT